MKFSRVATLALMAAVAIAPAFAQGRAVMRAEIPFDFVVGKKALPAGEYEVIKGVTSDAMQVRNAETAESALALTYGRHSGEEASNLTFKAGKDGKYVLTALSHAGDEREVSGPSTGKGAVVAKIRAVSVR